MNRPHFAGLLVALMATLLATRAAGEPAPSTAPVMVCTKESITLRADAGQEMRVPPGCYLPAPTYAAVDGEMRRLQDETTKLAAENESLRESASESPWGWGTLTALVTAVALGVAAGGYYF